MEYDLGERIITPSNTACPPTSTSSPAFNRKTVRLAIHNFMFQTQELIIDDCLREFDIGISVSLRQESFSVRDLLFPFAVVAVEAFNTSSRVNQLLLAGEEWMAFGANLQTNFGAFGGTCLKSLATGTNYIHLNVFGVDFLFHEGTLNKNTPDHGVEKQAIIGAGRLAGKVKSSKPISNRLYSTAFEPTIKCPPRSRLLMLNPSTVINGKTYLRADLHCHSYFSGKTDHVTALEPMDCYSSPERVYHLA